MNKILKSSLFFLLLLFVFTSNAMEEQKSTETITSEESQEQDKQHFAMLIQEQAEIIEAGDYKSLSDLEANIKKAIDQFEGDKEEFTKCLLEALTNDNMLIKIRNISYHDSSIINSLFDDNIIKFDPLTTLITTLKQIDENNTSEIEKHEDSPLVMTNLPQEIILHILILGLHGIINKDPLTSWTLKYSLEFINIASYICKKFYLLKGLLVDELKKLVHEKLLNETLRIAAQFRYNSIAKILINSEKVDIDEMDGYGRNPLLLTPTGYFSNKSLAQLLLESGANIEVEDMDGIPL